MFKKTLQIHVLLILCTLLCVSWVFAENVNIPVQIIQKNQADYSTPENAVSSFFSSSISGDLSWRNESITVETLKIKTEIAQKAGVDITNEMDSIRRNVKEANIVQKIPYKTGYILVVDIQSPSGDIFTLPYVFVQERGLWKLTSEFKADPEISTYIDLVPH